MNVHVTNITILEGKGLDGVFVYTALPFPLEFQCEDPLILHFDATPGTGKAYAEKHFPDVPIQVVKR